MSIVICALAAAFVCCLFVAYRSRSEPHTIRIGVSSEEFLGKQTEISRAIRADLTGVQSIETFDQHMLVTFHGSFSSTYMPKLSELLSRRISASCHSGACSTSRLRPVAPIL